MTIFLAHAETAGDAAEALARVLERRGLFVEHEGAGPERGLRASDVRVLMWSQDLSSGAAAGARDLTGWALAGWAQGRLILVALDRSPRPVGLRDLPAIDASFEQRWTLAWEEVVEGAAAIARLRSAPAASAPAAYAQAASAPAPGRVWRGAGLPLLALAGLCAGAWALVRFQVLDGWAQALGGQAALFAPLGLAVALGALGLWLVLRAGRALRQALAAGARKPPAGGFFFSYAHADSAAAEALSAGARARGLAVRMAKAGIAAPEHDLAETAQAIAAARGVVALTTARAFQSDRVKRALYLAVEAGKPLLAVSLEPDLPPADFEPLLAGARRLALHAAPAQKRPARLAAALAALGKMRPARQDGR